MRIWFNGTVLCKNSSGERFSARGILKTLVDHFDVCVFVPKEFSGSAAETFTPYGISTDQIFILPYHSRLILLMLLLGLKVPGLPVAADDFVWTADYKVFPALKRQFCVVQDLMAITAASYFPFFDRVLFRLSIRRIKKLRCLTICHSYYVKQQLMDLCGTDSAYIHVVPLGIEMSENSHQDTGLAHHKKIKGEYLELLYISAYQPRKNFELLIDYVRRLRLETDMNVRLTLVGPGLKERFSSVGQNSELRVLGYLSEEEKRQLISNSDIYVNPSAAEGFGLTNLEAQLDGLPVLCSDIPPFREVLGDSAAYFQWDSFYAFRDTLKSLSLDPDYLEALRQKGFENARNSNYRDNLLRDLVPKVAQWTGTVALTKNAKG